MTLKCTMALTALTFIAHSSYCQQSMRLGQQPLPIMQKADVASVVAGWNP